MTSLATLELISVLQGLGENKKGASCWLVNWTKVVPHPGHVTENVVADKEYDAVSTTRLPPRGGYSTLQDRMRLSGALHGIL